MTPSEYPLPNTPLLRGAFQVGVHKPNDFASVQFRARKLLGACAAHADALAPLGWSAAAQAALSLTIDTATAAGIDQSLATDAKEGLTGRRNLAANVLYK